MPLYHEYALVDKRLRGQHFILFTNTEYERYRKRLYGLFEKGFEVRTVRR